MNDLTGSHLSDGSLVLHGSLEVGGGLLDDSIVGDQEVGQDLLHLGSRFES